MDSLLPKGHVAQPWSRQCEGLHWWLQRMNPQCNEVNVLQVHAALNGSISKLLSATRKHFLRLANIPVAQDACGAWCTNSLPTRPADSVMLHKHMQHACSTRYFPSLTA
jgi:hypothetical protein